MKLFCFSEDKEWGKLVCGEAASLQWDHLLVSDRSQMAQALRRYDPDLLLLEIGTLTDLEWWKESKIAPKSPLIFVHQDLSEDYMVRALDSGADALMPKESFSIRAFAARARALLRRQGLHPNKRFVPSLNLMIDSDHNRVEIGGKAVALTVTEFKIVRELCSNEAMAVSRLELQTQVFGRAELANRSLDVHVCSMRKKIRPLGLDINCQRGMGYRIHPCSA